MMLWRSPPREASQNMGLQQGGGQVMNRCTLWKQEQHHSCMDVVSAIAVIFTFLTVFKKQCKVFKSIRYCVKTMDKSDTVQLGKYQLHLSAA